MKSRAATRGSPPHPAAVGAFTSFPSFFPSAPPLSSTTWREKLIDESLLALPTTAKNVKECIIQVLWPPYQTRTIGGCCCHHDCPPTSTRRHFPPCPPKEERNLARGDGDLRVLLEEGARLPLAEGEERPAAGNEHHAEGLRHVNDDLPVNRLLGLRTQWRGVLRSGELVWATKSHPTKAAETDDTAARVCGRGPLLQVVQETSRGRQIA